MLNAPGPATSGPVTPSTRYTANTSTTIGTAAR
jgi:hypothetical protein